jgi:hypothetical protein
MVFTSWNSFVCPCGIVGYQKWASFGRQHSVAPGNNHTYLFSFRSNFFVGTHFERPSRRLENNIKMVLRKIIRKDMNDTEVPQNDSQGQILVGNDRLLPDSWLSFHITPSKAYSLMHIYVTWLVITNALLTSTFLHKLAAFEIAVIKLAICSLNICNTEWLITRFTDIVPATLTKDSFNHFTSIKN